MLKNSARQAVSASLDYRIALLDRKFPVKRKIIA
jgi:hypothetical protein